MREGFILYLQISVKEPPLVSASGNSICNVGPCNCSISVKTTVEEKMNAFPQFYT